MRRSSWIFLAIAAVAFILLGGRALTELFVNKSWFAALGAEPVFWQQFQDTVLWRGGLFLAGTIFAFLNLYAVRRTILAVAVPSKVGDFELTAMLPSRRLMIFTATAAAFIGLLLAIPFDDWTVVTMARRGITFREIEFYFQNDLGHYVYWLPVEQALYAWSMLAVVVLMALVIVLYAFMRSLRLDGRRFYVTTHARRHLTVLGALMMALLAWSYRLDGFDLLRWGSGKEGQFLRVDHITAVRLDFGLCVFTLFAAMLLLRAGWAGQFRVATITLSLVLLGAIGVRHGVPYVLESSSAIGEPTRRDLDYLSTRAIVTRRAYDVEGMVVIDSDSSEKRNTGLQLRDLPRIFSIWDAPPLARNLNTGTTTRQNVGTVAWSPHENALEGLLVQRPSDADGAWNMVTVAGSVADDRGAPISEGIALDETLDSASLSSIDEDRTGIIGAPIIAPDARGHLLVIDTAVRIIGAPLRNEGVRIAHAWATRDPRILTHADNGATPTLVQWRDVRERVRKLAPIFAQGRDIVPVVYEGALYWTLELYSASENYPLSQRFMVAGDVRSYFRHAATALVHSRTGRVRLITVEKPDPIARTWMALAPDLFVTPDKLAPQLVSQLPPPTDGALAQTRAFARFGSRTDAQVARHLPDSVGSVDNLPGMLIEGAWPAAGWAVPVISGQEIVGIAIAAGGGKRGTRWMPVSKVETRWSTITEQLRTALDSSRLLLAEPGRREPQTSFGRVRVALVNGTPAAMQPLYVTRPNVGQALARVAIAHNGKVSVGSSVSEAVRLLENPNATSANNGAGTSGVPYSAAARQAAVNRLYDAMRAAMRRGDWTRFGSSFDSLGTLLGRPPQ
jgi:uncharacterized membrane protein (UPF0182 family)